MFSLSLPGSADTKAEKKSSKPSKLSTDIKVEAPKDQERKKKGGGKTVSSFFKGQLDDLMSTLYKTEPHFIRCVVPNTHKIPGGVESGLVMHQYQCNGVLAGIAICRAGFPNKMIYPEFKARYNILGILISIISDIIY